MERNFEKNQKKNKNKVKLPAEFFCIELNGKEKAVKCPWWLQKLLNKRQLALKIFNLINDIVCKIFLIQKILELITKICTKEDNKK